MCHDRGLEVKAFLMSGLPDETCRSIEFTREFLQKNPPDFWHISMLQALPGTPYYDYPEKFGLKIYSRDPRLQYPLGLNARGPVNHSTRNFSRQQVWQNREDFLDMMMSLRPSSRIDKAIAVSPTLLPVFLKSLTDYVI